MASEIKGREKTPYAYCPDCGAPIEDENDFLRNDGRCLPCYYASLEPDPDDGNQEAEAEAQSGEGKPEWVGPSAELLPRPGRRGGQTNGG